MKRLAVAILFVLSVFLVGANVANLQNDQERQPNATQGLFAGTPLQMTGVPTASVLLIDYLTRDDEGETLVSNLTSGTFNVSITLGNGIGVLNATTANQGLGAVQFRNGDNASEGIAAPAAGIIVVYEARVSIEDVDDCDWFIGLGEPDTTFMQTDGTLLANGADNHVGWHHLIADSGIPGLSTAGTALANQADVTQTAGTLGASGNLLLDSTYYRFGIRIEGLDTVQFFVNGDAVSAKATLGTALADGLVPTFTMIANGTSVDMNVDYTLIARTR